MSGPNRVLRIHQSSAPSLRDLQHQMAVLILEPPRDAVDLDALFELPERTSAIERLQVYAGGYPARLYEALADAFAAVAHIVGHGAFHALTARYIEERPPLYYNINDAGAGLPRFLRGDRLTADLPFLPGLAELEWSLVESFNAHVGPALDGAQLAALGIDDWDAVTLRLQPGLRVLESSWPLRELWEARATPVASIDVDLVDRPDRVLVYRSGLHACCESIDAGEAFALSEIQRGRALGDVAAALAARGCDGDAVSTWFGRWMGLGLIAGMTSP